MPYQIIEQACSQSDGASGAFQIINTEDGGQISCHLTQEDAEAALEYLQTEDLDTAIEEDSTEIDPAVLETLLADSPELDGDTEAEDGEPTVGSEEVSEEEKAFIRSLFVKEKPKPAKTRNRLYVIQALKGLDEMEMQEGAEIAEPMLGSIIDVSKGDRPFIKVAFSKLNVYDQIGDRTLAGAITKTVSERGPKGTNKIKFLFNHNPDEIIGTPQSIYEKDDMWIGDTLFARTQKALDYATLVEDGAITDASFAYDIIDGTPNEKGGLDLKQLRVWEYSIVTWGMNELAGVLKSRHNVKHITEQIERLSKAISKSNISDETGIQLELYVKQLKALV